jgi:hypothetical protein
VARAPQHRSGSWARELYASTIRAAALGECLCVISACDTSLVQDGHTNNRARTCAACAGSTSSRHTHRRGAANPVNATRAIICERTRSSGMGGRAMLSVAPISMVRDRLCLSGATREAPSIGEGGKDVSMRRRRDGFLAHLMMRIPFLFARILRMLGTGRSQNDAIIGSTACTCMSGAPLVMVGGGNPS